MKHTRVRCARSRRAARVAYTGLLGLLGALVLFPAPAQALFEKCYGDKERRRYVELFAGEAVLGECGISYEFEENWDKAPLALNEAKLAFFALIRDHRSKVVDEAEAIARGIESDPETRWEALVVLQEYVKEREAWLQNEVEKQCDAVLARHGAREELYRQRNAKLKGQGLKLMKSAFKAGTSGGLDLGAGAGLAKRVALVLRESYRRVKAVLTPLQSANDDLEKTTRRMHNYLKTGSEDDDSGDDADDEGSDDSRDEGEALGQRFEEDDAFKRGVNKHVRKLKTSLKENDAKRAAVSHAAEKSTKELYALLDAIQASNDPQLQADSAPKVDSLITQIQAVSTQLAEGEDLAKKAKEVIRLAEQKRIPDFWSKFKRWKKNSRKYYRGLKNAAKAFR